ncbi:MAG: PKD domain-containing protein, partial [Chloroflexota bacterium]
RSLLLVVSLFILLILVSSARHSLAFQPPVSGYGIAEIKGPVSFTIETEPSVVQPGDSFTLIISYSNATQSTFSPQLTFELPPNVTLQSSRLPSGMTMNFQSGQLNWLPVVSAFNGGESVSIDLQAGPANILNPEQAIKTSMIIDGQLLQADTRFWLGTAPKIDQIVLPRRVAIGQPVQLRGELSGSGPFSQSWDLGDGRIVDVMDPEVSFSQAGTYEIALTAVNPLTTDVRSRRIEVVPQPAAQFVLSDFTIGPNQPVEFINQSGGQGPLQTTWEFGDGNISTQPRPSHAYAQPGTYQIKLTVVNQYGRSEAYGSVTVGAPPNLQMQIQESVAAGDPILANAVGDSTITRFQWDFGNGRLIEGQQISSVFNNSGDYYVTLTAFNEFGQSSIGQWINVRNGSWRTFLPIIFQDNSADYTIVSIDRPIRSGGAGEGLPDVPLEQPFVMQPLALPPTLSMTEQLFVYVNEARRQFGLRSLAEVPQLSAAAQSHAVDMASFKYTGHVGSDGSAPIERFVQFQYGGGYAGEATAWGFEHPYQAVEFWVNSPSHRKIILNENATDLGVGYTVDLRAPSVWYWTTEYGNRFGSPFNPTIRPQQPLADASYLNTTFVNYGWVWPIALADSQYFEINLNLNGESIPLGTVTSPSQGIYYGISRDLLSLTRQTGVASWQITLKDGNRTLLESEPIQFMFEADPAVPTLTPTAVPTIQATPLPPTVTPTPFIPTPTSPANQAPPPLATATPDG